MKGYARAIIAALLFAGLLTWALLKERGRAPERELPALRVAREPGQRLVVVRSHEQREAVRRQGDAVRPVQCLDSSRAVGDRAEPAEPPALRVAGDSMIEENIRPGDYVICRRSEVAENGQLVVALVNEGEATLKRFYREGDGVRLQPANASMKPIYVRNAKVLGVLAGVVRKT